MKCEGEDVLWQDTSIFIWSLGWELNCCGDIIDGSLQELRSYFLAAAVCEVGKGEHETRIKQYLQFKQLMKIPFVSPLPNTRNPRVPLPQCIKELTNFQKCRIASC